MMLKNSTCICTLKNMSHYVINRESMVCLHFIPIYGICYSNRLHVVKCLDSRSDHVIKYDFLHPRTKLDFVKILFEYQIIPNMFISYKNLVKITLRIIL